MNVLLAQIQAKPDSCACRRMALFVRAGLVVQCACDGGQAGGGVSLHLEVLYQLDIALVHGNWRGREGKCALLPGWELRLATFHQFVVPRDA